MTKETEMTKIRKTIPRDDLVAVINRHILHADTVAEREALASAANSILLNWDDAYLGFKYVDSAGQTVPHTTVGTGLGYDPSLRSYF